MIPSSVFHRAEQLAAWAAHGPGWHLAVTCTGGVAGTTAAWLTVRHMRRTLDALFATTRERRSKLPEDQRADPFVLTVAVGSVVLCVEGMTRVFLHYMHLPLLPTITFGGVLELTGLALGRLARKRILAKHPADNLKRMVWGVAALSGLISSAASNTWIEAVLRAVLPLVAAVLWHETMLPVPDEVTLTEWERAKSATRHLRAAQRVARASRLTNRWAKWLQTRAADRLARDALVHGDSGAILDAAQRIAVRDALRALGYKVSDGGSEIEGIALLAHASGLTLSPPPPPAALPSGASTGEPGSLDTPESVAPPSPELTGVPASETHSGRLGVPRGTRPGVPLRSERGASENRRSTTPPPPRPSAARTAATPTTPAMEPVMFNPDSAAAGERTIKRFTDQERKTWEKLLDDSGETTPSQPQIQAAMGCGAGRAKNLQHALLMARSDDALGLAQQDTTRRPDDTPPPASPHSTNRTDSGRGEGQEVGLSGAPVHSDRAAGGASLSGSGEQVRPERNYDSVRAGGDEAEGLHLVHSATFGGWAA